MKRVANHAFQVDEWSGENHVRLIAGSDDLFVARAAYEVAVRRHPKAAITLRQGAMVLEEHKPEVTASLG
jgi:hypothetical protein